jgi:hypothetical protein
MTGARNPLCPDLESRAAGFVNLDAFQAFHLAGFHDSYVWVNQN